MTGPVFIHFQFLHLEPKFRALQTNEKVVARQDFLSALQPLQRNLPLFSTYALTGLRSECDILLLRAAPSLDILNDTQERLSALGVGKYLHRVSSYLAMSNSLPATSKAKYLFIRPIVRTKDWQLLPPTQKQELATEESKVSTKFPSVKQQFFDGFDVQAQEIIQTYETDNPSDFFSLIQETRNSKNGPFLQPCAPIYPCIRKDIQDIVETLG